MAAQRVFFVERRHDDGGAGRLRLTRLDHRLLA
jgi:hypothetical protein